MIRGAQLISNALPAKSERSPQGDPLSLSEAHVRQEDKPVA